MFVATLKYRLAAAPDHDVVEQFRGDTPAEAIGFAYQQVLACGAQDLCSVPLYRIDCEERELTDA